MTLLFNYILLYFYNSHDINANKYYLKDQLLKYNIRILENEVVYPFDNDKALALVGLGEW